MNLGGPAKVRCKKSKSTELYADKAGPPINKLFKIWHPMNKVAPFHSQLCVGFNMWHKRLYVNERTSLSLCVSLAPICLSVSVSLSLSLSVSPSLSLSLCVCLSLSLSLKYFIVPYG